MTRYYTNFEDSDIGTDPPTGWSRQWDAVTTPANHSAAVRYGSPLVKRREVRYNAAANSRGFISYGATGADTHTDNVEILTRVKPSDVAGDTAATSVELWCRAGGVTASVSGFRLLIVFSNDGTNPNKIFITRFSAGVGTSVLGATAVTLTSTKGYLVRWRVNDSAGSAVHTVTIWEDGTTEPTTATATATDAASPLAAVTGFVGFHWFGTAAAQGLTNFFSVGSNGDTAWKPRTNAEYKLWLSQTAFRQVLVEMSATGYDSGGAPFTKTVNAYLGNGGFTSQAWDSPASTFYRGAITQIPTFRRQMGLALNGRADVGFGSLIVSNAGSSLTGPGARDDWLRMKWKRSFITMYLGDPTWPKHDFRMVLKGRLEQPTATKGTDQIEFPISDLTDLLTQNLQQNRYSSSAARPNSVLPFMTGKPQWMELVPTAVGSLEFQLHDGSINSEGTIYDNGVSLASTNSVFAVNAATDTITATTAHGLVADSMVVFAPAGPLPPTGLSSGTTYYVITAGLTTTDFRLSATRGGAAVNITGTGTGAGFTGSLWWSDLANGKVTLVSNPSGRLMTRQAQRAVTGDDQYPARIMEYLIFTKYAASVPSIANYKDQAAFDAAAAITWSGIFFQLASMVVYDEITGLAALDRVAKAFNFWYGFTIDGLLQIGRLDLPTASAVLTLTQGDVTDLKRESSLLPINRATLSVRHTPRFVLNGPLAIAPATTKHNELFSMYDVSPGAAWGATNVPLDYYANLSDMKDFDPFETYFTDSSGHERDRLQNFYAETLGIFSFRTRLTAINQDVSIGSTIQLTHPRLGWKTYSTSDRASPDNPDTIDATKAVVIGMDVNLTSKSPMPVKLTVFRQIPGYYPTADVS